MRKLFIHISRIWGVEMNPVPYKAGSEMAEVSSFSQAWLLCENGRFHSWGSMSESLPAADEIIDAKNAELLPGFVDGHTHAVFAEPRESEWLMRLKGASYEEIAAAGGGILNSAGKLGLMDEQKLFEESLIRVQRMISHGSTIIEIKSGYGLSLESELKMLRVARRIGQNVPAVIKTTFLGAHAVPREYKDNKAGYIQLIINEMLPAIHRENLADHVDVFCDRGFFTPEETMQILEAADKYGLPSKIHANELGLTGGVQAAVAAGSWSADHLEHLGEEEIECLKSGSTMPVGLPGTSYFLGIPYAPGRRIIDAGLPFSLASDFNPGSSPVCNMQMVWSLACSQMKLLPSEAFHAITINAARGLRMESESGSISPGKRADFWLTDTSNAMTSVPYFFGINHAREVYLGADRW